MAENLLVFRVGYMSTYDGVGKIVGGGAHVKEFGQGGEMWNFRNEGGRCFGYVMSKNFAGIDLQQVRPRDQWRPNDEIDEVDIVFIATRPSVGQVVIGWYRDATVFHKVYRKRRGKMNLGDWEMLDYLCQVDAENAILLPEESRTFRVPTGKGFPGTSNVWYPHLQTSDVAEYVLSLRKYITSSKKSLKPTQRARGWKSAPDKDLVTKIEKAAILAVSNHYINDGYTVESVEKDNRGWDLEASKNGRILLIEVKGHIGNVVQFELTPNEYSQLIKNHKSYRLCLVRQALSGGDVEIYKPLSTVGGWALKRTNGIGRVNLAERIGARAFETE